MERKSFFTLDMVFGILVGVAIPFVSFAERRFHDQPSNTAPAIGALLNKKGVFANEELRASLLKVYS